MSVLDCAAHFKHLQSILLEYDPTRALRKPTMLKYFWKWLQLSIQIELEYQDLKLKSFDQLVKKVIEAEGKASLRPCITTWEIDQHCPRDFWLAITTVAKVNTLSSSTKDPRVEESKVRT